MNKDWVVWLGCILLFGAGAVWAAVPIGTKFFIVENVHDLFEIFSSIATVMAVCLAFLGVNAWQRQISAQSDHDLARRVAVESLRFKDTAVEAWIDAKFAINQYPYGVNSLPSDLMEKIAQSMEEKLIRRDDVKVKFMAVLQEARAIWGSSFVAEYDELLRFSENCNICSRSFVAWRNGGDRYINEMTKVEAYLSERNMLHIEGKVAKAVGYLTKDADHALDRKLLR